jgi:hypothetical protein
MGLLSRLKNWLWRNSWEYKKYTAGQGQSKPVTQPPIEVKPPPTGVLKYPPSWFDAALYITGGFEGAARFGNVTGDFDGQGMSCGVLQWCYGQGSLQKKILAPYINKYDANKLNGFFPINVAQTAMLNKQKACEFARAYMLKGGEVKPEYRKAWKTFLESPECVEIQKQAAMEIADRAWKLCHDWQMFDLKSFCLFFDILVQGGSIEISKPIGTNQQAERALSEAPGKNRALWNEELWRNAVELNGVKAADHVTQVLFVAAHLRAHTSNPRWFKDVFSRKGTIAMGVGWVHGDFYDYRDLFKNNSNQKV